MNLPPVITGLTVNGNPPVVSDTTATVTERTFVASAMSRRCGCTLMVVTLLGFGAWHATPSAECVSDTFLIDTTGSVTFVSAFKGEGPGQTFIAQDTLISAITVWRAPNQTPNDAPMKLWITKLDSLGRPRASLTVYEGPTIQAIYGDGVHPIEIRFELDPPAVLPHRGKFGFFVQNRCAYLFDLLIREGTAYADGELWRSEAANFTPGCPLKGASDRFDGFDLCSKIEFCSEQSTVVPRRSWGSVKILYR